MSRNDIKKARHDIKKARPVDFRAPPVDFRALVALNAESMALDVTHDRNSGYGKNGRNRSVICDQKVAF